jgi:ribosomal protein L24
MDPTVNQNHPAQAANVAVLAAVKGSVGKERREHWKTTAEQLGRKESYSALVKAADRLYLGGGKRDGSEGFVQIVSAADGKKLGEVALPARVTECGLAVAGGRLFACCEDGTVVCLGTP